MFKRLMLILRAKLSSGVERAEDPAELLDYSYQRQLEQLYQMRRDVADLVTAKKRVARQRDRRQDQFIKLQTNARKALELGREDLARRALERKQLVGRELVDLAGQVSDLEYEQAQLVARWRDARATVERFRTRKEITKAQYASAKAQLAISEAAIGLSSGVRDAVLRIERTRDRLDDLTVRAAAMEELEHAGTLASIGSGEDDIDRQLRQLTSGVSVDAELARMKSELNCGRSNS
jgi:phage shock protein A